MSMLFFFLLEGFQEEFGTAKDVKQQGHGS